MPVDNFRSYPPGPEKNCLEFDECQKFNQYHSLFYMSYNQDNYP